ncbi:hypothetical protein [Streptomyces sp. NRRL F-5135]|uniref:hypothetical protein n=1 Tax=Streptomyces sp. NRRL F-5135 TaxID=1463858 RepID=UPI00068F1E26|nr:hypothetical protein [Streptomyces sp. NRRL F-5135]
MADEHDAWLDEDAAESLLRGEPVAPAGDDRTRGRTVRLDAALRELAADADITYANNRELPGEAAAVAAFRRARRTAGRAYGDGAYAAASEARVPEARAYEARAYDETTARADRKRWARTTPGLPAGAAGAIGAVGAVGTVGQGADTEGVRGTEAAVHGGHAGQAVHAVRAGRTGAGAEAGPGDGCADRAAAAGSGGGGGKPLGTLRLVLAPGTGRRARTGREASVRPAPSDRPVRRGLAAAVAGCALGGMAVMAGAGALPSLVSGEQPPLPGNSVSTKASPGPYVSESSGLGAESPAPPDGTPGRSAGPSPDASSASPASPDGNGDDGRDARDGANGNEAIGPAGPHSDWSGSPSDPTSGQWYSQTVRACRAYVSGAIDAERERALESAADGPAGAARFCDKLLDGADGHTLRGEGGRQNDPSGTPGPATPGTPSLPYEPGPDESGGPGPTTSPTSPGTDNGQGDGPENDGTDSGKDTDSGRDTDKSRSGGDDGAGDDSARDDADRHGSPALAPVPAPSLTSSS